MALTLKTTKHLECPLCRFGICVDNVVAHMVTSHKRMVWSITCSKCSMQLSSCPLPYEQQPPGLYAWLHKNVPNHPCHDAQLVWTYTDSSGSVSPAAHGRSIRVMREKCAAYKLGGGKNLASRPPCLTPYLLTPKKSAAASGDEELLLGGFDLHDPVVRKAFCINAQTISAWTSEYNGTTYVDLNWPELSPAWSSKPFGQAVNRWRAAVKEAGLILGRFEATIPLRPSGLSGCTECGPDSAHSTGDSCTRWASCTECRVRYEWGHPCCECSARSGGSPVQDWCDWCDSENDHGMMCSRPCAVLAPYTLSWLPKDKASDHDFLSSVIRSALGFSCSRCDCSSCVNTAKLIESGTWESSSACAVELCKRPNLTCPRERRRFYPIPHLYTGTAGSTQQQRPIRFPEDAPGEAEARVNVWLKVKSINPKKRTLQTSGPGGFPFTNAWGLDEAFLASHPNVFIALVCGERGWCCVLSLPGQSVRAANPGYSWGEWLCPRAEFQQVRIRETPIEQLSDSFVRCFVPNAAFKAYGRTVPSGWIKRNLRKGVQGEHVSPEFTGVVGEDDSPPEISPPQHPLLLQNKIDPPGPVKAAVKRFYRTMGSEPRENKRLKKAVSVLVRSLNCDALAVDPKSSEPYTAVARLFDDSYTHSLRCDPNPADACSVLRDYMQPADPRAARLDNERVEELCMRADEVGLFSAGVTARAVLMYAACRHGIFPAWDLETDQWTQIARENGHSLLAQTVLRYYNRFALKRCLPCHFCEKTPNSCTCVVPRCLLCNVGLHGPWACELLVRPTVPFYRLAVELKQVPSQ
ncbi:protein ORF96 [Cyprinid herpesvirus 1]|uniref:Protein ORF96 n=1 Tax=Cyprinid herpesvirus 1 TaxID=317858 RepID=K7PBX6_9VIRU|nr:protein ORF96 [Cyprinid herpesvirus 1]AFJ20393.1 protein ORF96 [Cyprinid herpesvirus 1]